MARDKSPPPAETPQQKREKNRADRLAEALRRNLARRKAVKSGSGKSAKNADSIEPDDAK